MVQELFGSQIHRLELELRSKDQHVADARSKAAQEVQAAQRAFKEREDAMTLKTAQVTFAGLCSYHARA